MLVVMVVVDLTVVLLVDLCLVVVQLGLLHYQPFVVQSDLLHCQQFVVLLVDLCLVVVQSGLLHYQPVCCSVWFTPLPTVCCSASLTCVLFVVQSEFTSLPVWFTSLPTSLLFS